MSLKASLKFVVARNQIPSRRRAEHAAAGDRVGRREAEPRRELLAVGTSRHIASASGERSPATIARMIRMPVAPMMSVTAWWVELHSHLHRVLQVVANLAEMLADASSRPDGRLSLMLVAGTRNQRYLQLWSGLRDGDA